MKKIFILTVILVIIIDITSYAQRWKRNRWDIMGGIGATTFLGDLGGGNMQAAHFFGVRDIDISSTLPVFNVGLRYKLAEIISIKFQLSYGWLSGDDNLSSDLGRKARNLHFFSHIFEGGAQLEFSFIKEKIGSRYAISRGSFQNLINAYGFVGAGWIHFNPKAEYQGQWYELQPLGTEGQGVSDEKQFKYPLSAIAIPFGLGIKYTLTTDLSIGLELGFRFTTSDYIDDVSGRYFNFKQEELLGNIDASEYDPMVLQFADRSTPKKDYYAFEMDGKTVYTPNGLHETNSPEPRGGSQFNDSYMFTIVYVAYKLKTSRSGLPKFR